ncbi:histidine phosphatase family protein [Litoribacillus peritrichatus]|uniref:phosphoglycerate mutase (2,3-diphosphoglycerate-dependent) n=1 Tax=Litoribacillus peritrichatus TaxID=718191 RepID=A0ABP7MFP5_9GAMM
MTKDNSLKSLTLLRHGITEAGKAYIGVTDAILTEEGRQQMLTSVGQRISEVGHPEWDVIVTSPLLRCLSFSKELSAMLSIPYETDPAFREYDFGVMENLTAIEVLDQHPGVLERFWEDPLSNPPTNGESLSDFDRRILDGLADIYARFSGKSVLLVAHGGVIRGLLCHKHDKPIQELMNFEVNHGQLISY